MGDNHKRCLYSICNNRRTQDRSRGTSSRRCPPDPATNSIPTFPGAHLKRNLGAPGKGGDRRGHFIQELVPVPDFRNPQTRGITKSDPKHEGHKQIHNTVAFPHGHLSYNPSLPRKSGSSSINRPSGRILPCTHACFGEKSSGIPVRGQDLQIQGSPLRSATSSESIYQGDRDPDVLPQRPRTQNLFLLRRLDLSRELGGQTQRPLGAPNHDHARTGIYNKLEKVRTDSLTHAHLFRGSTRLSKQPGKTQPREGRDLDQPSKILGFSKKSPSSNLAKVARLLSEPGGPITGLQTFDETFPDSLSKSLQAEHQFATEDDPRFVGDEDPDSSMVRRGFYSPRKAVLLPSSVDHGDHGRISNRLGRPLSGPLDFRRMGPSNTVTAHKCSGTSSGMESLNSFQEPVRKPDSSYLNGQHSSNVIHKSTRRNTLFDSEQIDLSTMELVQSREHRSDRLSHPRSGECDSGLPFERKVSSVGMDAVGKDLLADKPEIRPPDRPVRVIHEQQTSDILLQNKGREGDSVGRIFNSLDRSEGVCVPSLQTYPTSSQEDQGRQSIGDSHRTTLAQPSVVSRSSSSIGGGTLAASMVQGSGLPTSVRDSPRSSGAPQIDRLAVIGESARAEGFSERAASLLVESRRASTRKVYSSRLNAFIEWCEEKGIAPREASLPAIADFIIALYDKGKSLSTLRGYRSAIAAIHIGFEDGSSVSSAPRLSALLRSLSLKRPNFRPLVPSWSLPKVLEALAKPPFEPLHSASLLDTTIKTCFLLAVASGQRVSSLHALSIARGHIRWENGGVRLIPNAKFIAKNQSETSGPVEIFLRPLTKFSSIREDKVWCPVRALKWYLDKVKNLRKSDQLFVITKAPFSPASKSTLSRWIVAAIKAAGSNARVSDTNLRAHDTRSISSSWALFQGVSVEEICRAAYWRSQNSFTTYYLKDVPAVEGNFSIVPIHAAASSIVN